MDEWKARSVMCIVTLILCYVDETHKLFSGTSSSITKFKEQPALMTIFNVVSILYNELN
jgi:hypothetical protein